jgi:hypothetical protein
MLPTITNNTARITKTTNKFDVEIDEKNRSEEDAKTQLSAEYMMTTIACY